MKTFQFTGDWETELKLESLKGFQSRRGDYDSKDSEEPSDGTVQLTIKDEANEEPDPKPEQLEAIKYLLANQENIVKAICRKVLDEYKGLMESYGCEGYDNVYFPEIKTMEDVKSIMGISQLHVMIHAKDGVSYIGYEGGCNWDEEHGIGFMMHKDRIIDFGYADVSFYEWEVRKDNNTYEETSPEDEERPVPRKFKPHPKYGKLKPAQIWANETYEIDLISGNFNSIFQEMVEKGEININGKWESQDKNFLEAAVWFNNNELVKYLLSKGADTRFAIHEALQNNSNEEAIEILLAHGVDINAPNQEGETLVLLELKNMVSLYHSKENYAGTDFEQEMAKNIEGKKKLICELIKKGADPLRKNLVGENCYDLYHDLNSKNQKEIKSMLDDCSGNK